ncbi:MULTISPECIES: CBS domain-containing protein [unclassified Mesorhizobium]|uniref:CBS domain-containing protein n=1 Tax=unclassified Mesorhizobium TaxID=325217 RepID=UPI0011294BC7|nr:MULTISPECIES: CBS domain-containing protein [unclassified Mesorhizobium]MBZ9702827.1 CBS domain-containing protein [Mesorhizobium sp. CO1-1-3]MBZ9949343.1 CBS domain-containing protein [Mesorhizobium sp. BR1-1-11]TPJ01908.1 CBS domain-containing protein [Mesorhizobium sp. B2-8-1]
MLIAKDVMTSPVIAVGPDSTVDEVAGILLSHGISAVPVIDRGALLGIVSEGDLIRRAEIGTAPQGCSWWLHLFTNNAVQAEGYVKSHSDHVIDVMTQQVATVVESTPVAEIATLLEHNRIKRAPVLRDGRWLGSSAALIWCERWSLPGKGGALRPCMTTAASGWRLSMPCDPNRGPRVRT